MLDKFCLILYSKNMNGKYIIFERGGLEFPVLIPKSEHFVAHSEIRGLERDTPVAAGFFSIGDDRQVFCHGQSVSMGLKSRGSEDIRLLEKFCFGD